jgi:hypothetical protein
VRLSAESVMIPARAQRGAMLEEERRLVGLGVQYREPEGWRQKRKSPEGERRSQDPERRCVVELRWIGNGMVCTRLSASSAVESREVSGRQMRVAWTAEGSRLVQRERRSESGTSGARCRR